jgi:carbonic anhydrase
MLTLPNNAAHRTRYSEIQSPVDIGDNTIRAQLAPLKMTWAKSADTIVNNGHTIQLNMGDSSTLSIGGGGNYRLVQFHFHRPSEHTINGASFPMEVHFVHQNAAGALAVVGVLMTAGRPNKAFTTIVLTMPNREGPPEKADPKIDPNAFLPAKRSYYRYSGSLTTPPCSETVDWLLLTDPIQVAEADVVAQEAALAQIEQTLPPLQRQLAQQRNLITALIGRLSNKPPSQTFTLESLKLPRDLPLSLPSVMVRQRPDVLHQWYWTGHH